MRVGETEITAAVAECGFSVAPSRWHFMLSYSSKKQPARRQRYQPLIQERDRSDSDFGLGQLGEMRASWQPHPDPLVLSRSQVPARSYKRAAPAIRTRRSRKPSKVEFSDWLKIA